MDKNKVTALVVDDDSSFRMLVKHLLESYNTQQFEVLTEVDGESALNTLKSNSNINLVLMDYLLKKGTGIDIMKRFREENIAVPIIFLTSSNDYRTAVEAFKHGAVDYLLKDSAMGISLPKTILKVLESSEIKRQREEVENQNFLTLKKEEAIRELVVTMCHEFNNPLAIIKMSTASLQRQKFPEINHTLIDKLNAKVSQLEVRLKILRDVNIEGHVAEST
ncbi:MAG: response regulator [Ignavibacteriae bacterium]|nr:response regulator [Ignavibacteriota bacterium]